MKKSSGKFVWKCVIVSEVWLLMFLCDFLIYKSLWSKCSAIGVSKGESKSNTSCRFKNNMYGSYDTWFATFPLTIARSLCCRYGWRYVRNFWQYLLLLSLLLLSPLSLSLSSSICLCDSIGTPLLLLLCKHIKSHRIASHRSSSYHSFTS